MLSFSAAIPPFAVGMPLATSLSGEEFWPILMLTLRVSGTAVLISSVIGIPLGAILGRARFWGKGILSAIVFTGMAMPPVVIGLALYLLLSRSGPLGSWAWLFTPMAMILAQTILATPFVIGITMTAVAAVPDDLLLQMRGLGASKWQTRFTALREARHGVLLAVATAFGRCISEVGAVLMVGGNLKDHTRVLTTAIVLETRRGQFEFALVLGGTLLALALLVNLFIVQFRGHAYKT